MKVLIISHNPITDYNSMGKTLLSLFHDFDPAQLCQLYIYPTIPNVPKCGSYYRVTDKDVLKNILPFNQCGRVISQEEIAAGNKLYENPDEQKLYRNKAAHRELKLLARSFIWRLGRWDTKAFRAWMDEQKPQVIFACAGLSAFFYRIILKIAKRYQIPVVSYVCDDFYFSTEALNRGLLQKCYYPGLRRRIGELMGGSQRIVTICDAMSEAYGETFGRGAETICTGAGIPIASRCAGASGQILRYFGNLQLNRYHSLCHVAQALLEINQRHGTDYVLEIYTADPCPQDLKGLPTAKVMGFVDRQKLQELMTGAALLVHTESFEAADIERVRYSVSTKIADSLASGVPLFAYGSEQVASVRHLTDNDCGFVASSREDLERVLLSALQNGQQRQRIGQNALRTAAKYHDSQENSRRLKKILMDASGVRIAK